MRAKEGSYHIWINGGCNTVTEIHEPCRDPDRAHDHRVLIYRPDGRIIYDHLITSNDPIGMQFVVDSLDGYTLVGDRTVIIGCLAPDSDPWANHPERADRPPVVGVWRDEKFYTLVGPCHVGPMLWEIEFYEGATKKHIVVHRASLTETP